MGILNRTHCGIDSAQAALELASSSCVAAISEPGRTAAPDVRFGSHPKADIDSRRYSFVRGGYRQRTAGSRLVRAYTVMRF